MNWLRDKLRAWLNAPTYDNLNGILAVIGEWKDECERLRTELDALKGEVRAREPRPQQVTMRITVDDYETSQLKALDEFKDQKEN